VVGHPPGMPRPGLPAGGMLRRLRRPSDAERVAAQARALEAGARGLGERATLSLLCEAVAELVEASDCLVSTIDADLETLTDHAGFTRVPQRWEMYAGQYMLEGYPATFEIVHGGPGRVFRAADPACDPAEREFMLRFGLAAELVTAFTAAGRRFVLEAWRDDPQAGLGEAELALAESLVAACIPAVERSFLVDREHEDRFGAAVLEAEELGTADRTLPDQAVAVGVAMSLDEDALRDVRLVALVHDASRRSIPDALLSKTDPLTPVEWAVIQRGTLVGQRMLARMPFLAGAVEGAGAVRERWDGTGYPRGLAGEAIPLPARVVSVCAAYRAMLRGRPGREPLEHAAALTRLDAAAGTQFDPAVVRAALGVLRPEGPPPLIRLRLATI
jgi:HD-GYP domain-containing protein (c-di-GMP phosphodiesterase class II)